MKLKDFIKVEGDSLKKSNSISILTFWGNEYRVFYSCDEDLLRSFQMT